jgi:hypothetical protein
MLIIIKFDYFEGNSKSVGKKKKRKEKGTEPSNQPEALKSPLL